MATLIDPEDLLIQYSVPHRDPRAFEGIFNEVQRIRKIYIPPGDFELTRMLVVTEPVIIEGEGVGISNLIYNGIGPAIILFFADGTQTGSGIQNLTLKSESPQATTSGIRIDSAEQFFVRNLEFKDFSGTESYGLLAQNDSTNIILDNVKFDGNTDGLLLDGVDGCVASNLSLNSTSRNVYITDSNNFSWRGGTSAGSPISSGIYIEDGYSISIEGIRSNLSSSVYGIETFGTSNESIIIRGCSFENTISPKKGIKLDSVVGGSVAENRFESYSAIDSALELLDSSGVTVGQQGPIYPDSPSLSSTNSGLLWGFGDAEGDNTGVDLFFTYSYLNVRDFGATGDGTTDDTVAIQSAVDSIVESGRQAAIYLPAGTYITTEPILLPVAVQGLEIFGAGRDESTGRTTTIRNNNVAGEPMFQTSGTGTFAYFKCHDFRLLQSASAGYYFQFDNLTVDMELYSIHMNMSNVDAGAVFMNGVENHLNWIHDCKVVTNGATVPMFYWLGPAASNMSTTKFERVTVNSPNSTAPQYEIRHRHTIASPGFKFVQCNIEQPDGGGVHLYGVSSVIDSCIVSDTASQTAPVFLVDRHSTGQYANETVFLNCGSYIGNATNPDIAIRNTPGLPLSPGPVNIIGGRYVYVENYLYSVMHRIGCTISNYSGDGEVYGMWLGALNTRGISNEMTANGTNRPRSLSGTATFTSGDTVTVSLVPSDPEADTNYQIILGQAANESFWVDESSKTTTTFQIKSSNPASTASIAWMMVR